MQSHLDNQAQNRTFQRISKDVEPETIITINNIEMKTVSDKERPYWCEITPELAAKMLKMIKKKYRKLKTYVVIKYTREMKKGLWAESSDCIAFDHDGCLVNGQHRLHSCVKSGKTLICLVLFNLSKNAVVDGIDSGYRLERLGHHE